MNRPCYKQAELTARIEEALGTSLGSVSCNIVDEAGMAEVMAKAGWSRNQAAGVVGFHHRNQVWVLTGRSWTVLHELIHQAGVNADRLASFVAEGLTEAIAREICQPRGNCRPDEHRPTYPQETRWVQEELLPALGMSAVELGQVIVRAKNAPRALAKLMAEARPNTTNERALARQLRAQRRGRPDFNRGDVTRAPSQVSSPLCMGSDCTQIWLGVSFLFAGAALLVPVLLRDSRGAA